MTLIRAVLATVACLALSLSSNLVLGKQLYLVSMPRIARPGHPLDVSVFFYPPVSPYHRITTQLMGTNENYNRTYWERTFNAHSIIFSPIQIRVPGNLEGGTYRVVVSGARAGFQFQEETTVTMDTKVINTFVQTDKGMYSPGNTVRYRILSLDQNIRTYKGKYDVIIFDPARNRIKQDLGVSDRYYGLIQGELKLSSEPILGEWRISVTTEFNSFTKTFEVRKYVLPRYSVTVTPVRKYIVSSDQPEISDQQAVGTIAATYTTGKPVRGRATVTAKLDPWYRPWRADPSLEQPSITRHLLVDGEAGYSFDLADLKKLAGGYIVGKSVTVEVSVTEDLTGEVASSSASTKVYNNALKIEAVSSNPKTFKPTLKYTGYLKVVQQDGSPPIGATDKLILETKIEVPLPEVTKEEIYLPQLIPQPALVVEQPPQLQLAQPIAVAKRRRRRSSFFPYYPQPQRSEWITLGTEELDVPPSGLVQFSREVPENATSVQFTARYGALNPHTISAKRFRSPSDSYLQISLLNDLPKVCEETTIELKSNVEFTAYSYLVLSRGRIVRSRNFRLSSPRRSVHITFDVIPEMGPTARLIAFFLVGDEVVADYLTFNVEGAFKNKVSMEFDAEEVKPGERVNVLLTADPYSLVGSLVVDQSVILLKSGFDFSFPEIQDSLGKFDVGKSAFPTYFWRRRRKRLSILPWPYPSYGGPEDAKAVFEETGVKVLSNALIYDYVEPIYNRYPMMYAMADSVAMPMVASVSAGGFAPVERIRSRFIETWLWKIIRVGGTGQRWLSLVAPDTMTTWVGTAFGVDRLLGFGMTETPTTIRVLQKFYVNVVLPYSVIRGEQVVLQANVFNYGDNDLEVEVTLKSNDGFSFLGVDADGHASPIDSCAPQYIKVGANNAKAVYFPIVPTELGDVDVTVLAKSKEVSDGLTKQLRVAPEGIPQEYNLAVVVDLTDPSVSTYSEKVPVSFPPSLVPGSERVVVKVLGDILSNTINNLSKLIRMSYGCGEQNMINFAPTVHVATYLESVGQLTGERKTTTLDIILSGYQRQMNYQRHDGSFSAFGNRDPSGSTWLSLFVWKSFQQARKLVTIDEQKHADTLRFIQRQQNEDGSFNEPGRVIHKDMQGGSASGIGLTAYALSALIQGNSDGSLDEAIARAQAYVEGRILAVTDPYILTICAYALELAESSLLQEVRQKVKDAATVENGHVYWKSETEFQPHYSWRCPNQRSSAADVEATAYGLLACCVEGKDISPCLTILPWLVGQQNSNGGFVSTQDTVVAVQALSSLASKIYSDDNDMSIDIESGGEVKHFRVNKKNRFLYQSAILSDSPGDVAIHARGSGRVIAQVSVRYNIYEDFILPVFDAYANVTEESDNDFALEVCAKNQRNGSSGMALIEVQLPSGFSPADSTEKDLWPICKRVEVNDRGVVLYLDEINGDEFCFPLLARRTGLVAKPKPGRVSVINYYEPDLRAGVYFLPKTLASSDFCNVCDIESCPVCQAKRK